MSGLKKENVGIGETVCVVLKNAKTGEKRTIESKKSSVPVPTEKIEITITNLVTGKVQHYEINR